MQHDITVATSQLSVQALEMAPEAPAMRPISVQSCLKKDPDYIAGSTSSGSASSGSTVRNQGSNVLSSLDPDDDEEGNDPASSSSLRVYFSVLFAVTAIFLSLLLS